MPSYLSPVVYVAPLDAMGREAAIEEQRLAFDSPERS